jgi:hypothetical protein
MECAYYFVDGTWNVPNALTLVGWRRWGEGTSDRKGFCIFPFRLATTYVIGPTYVTPSSRVFDTLWSTTSTLLSRLR